MKNMKFSMKRLAALALALVMVFGLLPVVNNTVNAVDVSGLTDGSIGLSYTNLYQPNVNVSSWSASGNTINGVLQGVKKAAIYMKAESTLTIQNNKSSVANLSFDYTVTTLNGSTVTIDGTLATGGSFEKKLEAGESISIVLFGPQNTGNKDNKVTIAITNLILASASNDPVTTTFEAPAYGSYTVAYGSETMTVAAGTPSQTASNLPSVAYTLTANPGAGYKLVGWYNVTTDTYLGTASVYTGSFEEACTVKAVIVPEESAVFKVGTNYFADLNDAVAYAQSKGENQITLVQSGTLAAGDYTVPAGITLLIPMDTEYTPTRTDDEDFGVAPEFTTEFTTPYAFLTMTMADGAKLTVNGTLDVESKHTSLQGGKNTGGRPCGPYGAIYMNPEASITVGNGANLYAWGYIYGDGSVTANAGAKVYEIMQVTDFPGGSNMSQFVDTDPTFDVDGDGNPANDYFKTFPFSQYYVQNIEVALTLKAGAAEYVYITMTAGGQSMGLPVRFIGEGGMFVPGENGAIVKDYDPSTDRLNVTVNGDASMAGIALDLSGTKYEGAVKDVLGTSKVDSASFILTLNGNITINIASGTTTVKQDLSLLPGVEINIAKNATLVVAERAFAEGEFDNLTVFASYTGYNIYVWDLDNWGNFVFKNKPLVSLTYSPTTGRYVRTANDLKDVKIDINGTVICEGYIYSTVNFDDEAWMPLPGAGAQVISTGKTGKLVLQNGPGPEEMAYCLDGYSDKDSAVFVDSVWLLNGDGTYVLTEGCEPGTTYSYCDVHDLWYTEGHGNCVVINTVEITWIVNGVGAPEEYLLGETPAYKGTTPTKPANGCTVYTFAGWATSANGAVLGELPIVEGDAVYYAIFTESVSHTGELEYTHVDIEFHKVTWSCCGAVVSEEAEHQDLDNDGYCDCGDVYIKIFVRNAKIFGIEMEEENIGIFVKPGTTYTTDVAPADGWQKVYVEFADFSTNAWDQTPNATQLVLGPEYTSAYNENLEINICSYWDLVIDMNGGDLIEGEEQWFPEYDPESSILKCAIPSLAYTTFDMLKTSFVREGYTLIGITDGQTTYTGEEEIAPNGEDLHLTLIWKADHVCSENLTEVEAVEPDCDTNGVKAYWSCSCGKYYADANASTEIPDLAAWKNGDGKIEKLGHGHTAGLYYEEDDENHHTVYCNDCDAAIKGNVKCTDTIDDGDHKCDFCPNENITDHSYDPATHECECGALETFTVTWLFNGGVMDEATKQELISEGFTVTDTSASSTFPYGNFAPSVYGITKDGYNLVGYTDQYGNFNEGQQIFTLAEDMTFTLVWECAHAEKNYTDLKNGFHKVTCGTCGETLVESEGHDYTYDRWDHECQCGAVEEFKLTVVYGVNGEHTYEAMLPYWTRMDSLDVINNIPWFVYDNDATHFGYFYLDDFYWDMDGDGDLDRDRYFTEGYMAGRDMYVEARYDFNGFVHDGIGWKYRDYGSFYKNEMVMLTMADVYENGSDEELEGIYMVGADGYRIENGMGRWYYLGYNPFSGITYEPNAEDIAYYESKGQTFIDKEMTWYYFGADGKLAENYTGLVGDSYVINGQAAWHVGLVEIDGEYYYFKGDEVNGGNKMVSGGDFYLNRNNTSFNLVPGGIYTFDNDGKMQWKFHGIVESDLFEGKRHYIGGRLTPGLGLMDLTTAATDEVRYFYVDSYGQLILDAEYYIGANNFGLAKGIYYFDAEGFLVIPEEEPGKSGLFFEDGKWYYYVDGAKAYCAGLIEIDGNWVYVKSDGSLATGIYYITNNNGHATVASGTKCTFDDNGVMIDPVINKRVLDEGNCTIENFDWDSSYVFAFTPDQDGKLTIDVFNIVLDDEYENVGFVVDVLAENYGWLGENFVLDGNIEYFVSGNMGQCWVYIYPAYEADGYSNTAPGTFDYKISFGNDGAPKNGIIDGYYYVDGHIAYGAGLIEIDGVHYYVRSNGQIVTDCQYWITNVNDTGYEPGLYEFDVDGWMSEIYVETFTGIKDGYFYVEDKIAYNVGLKPYDGGYIYVRSNGQIATGKYWITNHNDLLPEGFYDFGENGVYYPDVPENAYLVKDVDKVTDEYFGLYTGRGEAICPSVDGYLYIQVTNVTYSEDINDEAGFRVEFQYPDYWLGQMEDIDVVGTGTVMVPVSAGDQLVVYVNPADISADGSELIHGTITYKIWSTMECELEEVQLGE